MVNVLAIFSGLFLYASFAPLNAWWCAPLSLALLLRILQDRPRSIRLRLTFLFGISFFAPLLAWSNTYVGNLPWLLLTLLQSALILPLAIFPFQRARPHIYLYFPSLFVANETLRSRFPFGGFGWGRIAFGQADAPYASVARWVGAPGLAFLVCLISVSALLFLQRVWRIFSIVSLALLFVSPLLLSGSVKASPDFSVLAVQGGVPSLGLDFNVRARAVFELHRQATKKFFQTNTNRPDLVLWPENAVDIDPLKDEQVRSELQELVDSAGTPFIIGAVLEGGANFLNASLLWSPKVGPGSIYIKRHLTPFGEYIPWRSLSEFISPYAQRVVDFQAGKKVIAHEVGSAQIAPIICFELLDDVAGRQMAAKSNLLVVQTNSATFGRSPESAQQLGITRIRAIEHQRYVISVATSGVSAFIDPNGVVMQRSNGQGVATLLGKVALIDQRTFSDRHGGVVEVLLILLPVALLFTLTGPRRILRKRL